MLPGKIIGSKHLKNDKKKMIQYRLAHFLKHSLLVFEISCHFEFVYCKNYAHIQNNEAFLHKYWKMVGST